MTYKCGHAVAAFVAVFAILATTASAKYDSEVAKTFTHAISITNHVITTSAGMFTCKKATSKGVQEGTLVTGSSPSVYTAKTIRTTPGFSECTAFGFPAETKVNGCEFEFLEPTALAAGAKIICPIGKQIEIIAIGFCTMTIGSQSPTGSVSFNNEGSGTTRDIKVTINLTGISYGGNCGSGTNGTYTGTTTVKGYSNEALTTQAGIWVTS